MVRGYRSGSSITALSDSEVEALAGEPPNIVELAHFSAHDQVDRARLDLSYYVYPDGRLAADTLDALRLAMQRSGRDAVAYVRLGDRERMVLIQPHGAGLMMSTLRRPRGAGTGRIRRAAGKRDAGGMVEIAEGIISRRQLDGDANMLHDRYEQRLRSLIEQKSGGAAGLPSAARPHAPRRTGRRPRPYTPPRQRRPRTERTASPATATVDAHRNRRARATRPGSAAAER